MQRWKTIGATEPNAKLRASYGTYVLILAELTPHLAVWKAALEDWNLDDESQVVREWIAEGKVKGRVETRIADILELLRLRFSSHMMGLLKVIVELFERYHGIF